MISASEYMRSPMISASEVILTRVIQWSGRDRKCVKIASRFSEDLDFQQSG